MLAFKMHFHTICVMRKGESIELVLVLFFPICQNNTCFGADETEHAADLFRVEEN